jgi:hypothetical protein
MESKKKYVQKVWFQAHAVIQYQKSGVWYIHDFPVLADSNEETILKALHKEALETRYHELDVSHNLFMKLGKLPLYWIHLLNVDTKPVSKMYARYKVEAGQEEHDWAFGMAKGVLIVEREFDF